MSGNFSQSLTVKIKADASLLQREMKKAQNATKKATQQMSSEFRKAANASQKMQKTSVKSAEKVRQSFKRVSNTRIVDAERARRDALKAQQVVDKASRKMRKSFKKIGKTFRDDVSGVIKRESAAIKTALGGSALAASLVSVAFIKMAQDFQIQMTQVRTLIDGMSDETFNKMGDAVLALGARMGQETASMTKALFDVVSASVPAAEAISFLEVATKAATAGNTGAAVSVDALTTVVNAYGGLLGETLTITERAAKAADILFTVNKFGKTTYEALSTSIGRVSNVAAQLEVSFEEVGAAVATLTRRGGLTAEVMTGLNQTFVSVLKPADQAKQVAKELGIDFSVASIKARGFAGFLQHVKERAGENEEALAAMFGNVRAIRAVFPLVGKAAQDFTNDIENMKNAAGNSEKAFQKVAATTAQKMKVAMQTLKNFATSIGLQVLPAINEMIQAFGPGIKLLLEWTKETRAVEMAMKGVAKVFLSLKLLILPAIVIIETAFQGLRITLSEVAFRVEKAWIEVGANIKEIYIKILKFVQKALSKAGTLSDTAANAARELSDIIKQEQDNQLKSVERIIKKQKQLEKDREFARKEQLQQAKDSLQFLGDEIVATTDLIRGVKKQSKVEQEKAKKELKAEEERKKLRKKREQDFERDRQLIQDATDFFSEALEKRTKKLGDEIEKQKDKMRELKAEFKKINQDQIRQAESFEERRSRIISAGLSSEGKQLQKRGLARFFTERAQDALKNKEFDEARRLFGKAQDIFGGLAEDQGNKNRKQDFAKFLGLQNKVTKAFELQKKSNRQAQNATRENLQKLRNELKALFEQAQKKINVEIVTDGAKAQLEELRAKFKGVFEPFVDSGLLSFPGQKITKEKNKTKQQQLATVKDKGKVLQEVNSFPRVRDLREQSTGKDAVVSAKQLGFENTGAGLVGVLQEILRKKEKEELGTTITTNATTPNQQQQNSSKPKNETGQPLKMEITVNDNTNISEVVRKKIIPEIKKQAKREINVGVE